MVDGPPEVQRRSRRQLLLGSASVAAGGFALAACGGSRLREKVNAAASVPPGDVGILNALLDLEYHAIAAYTAGIPLLHLDEGGRAARQFLGQEMSHAVALQELVRRAKAKPAKPRASYDLGSPTSGEDVLLLLHKLENRQLAAYVSMIPLLAPGKVRSAATAIFANDAQHIAVLRSRLGRFPAPAPFVTGGE